MTSIIRHIQLELVTWYPCKDNKHEINAKIFISNEYIEVSVYKCRTIKFGLLCKQLYRKKQVVSWKHIAKILENIGKQKTRTINVF